MDLQHLRGKTDVRPYLTGIFTKKPLKLKHDHYIRLYSETLYNCTIYKNAFFCVCQYFPQFLMSDKNLYLISLEKRKTLNY